MEARESVRPAPVFHQKPVCRGHGAEEKEEVEGRETKKKGWMREKGKAGEGKWKENAKREGEMREEREVKRDGRGGGRLR